MHASPFLMQWATRFEPHGNKHRPNASFRLANNFKARYAFYGIKFISVINLGVPSPVTGSHPSVAFQPAPGIYGAANPE